MSRFAAAFYTEALKARRSPVPWLVGALAALPPVMLGVMMAIVKDPVHSRRLGLLTDKAAMMGTPDWPTFLGRLGQIMGAIGAMAFTVVTAWVFGREFIDRTCRIILATRTRRWAIVTAKQAVAAMWCIALSAWMVVAALIAGALVGMPGWSWQLVRESVASAGLVALLSLLLQPVTALLASLGRGYLLPIGLSLVTAFAAQFIGNTGWAPWFPWAVAFLAGAPGTHTGFASIVVVILTGVLALAGTLLWWERADQVG